MEIEVFEKSQTIVWLGAVSHCADPRSVRQFWIFGHFNLQTRRSVILHGVRLGAVSHCPESCFSRISSRKRIFHQNHFRPFIRDPNRLDAWKTILQKILWHCLFKALPIWFEYWFWRFWKKGRAKGKGQKWERKILFLWVSFLTRGNFWDPYSMYSYLSRETFERTAFRRKFLLNWMHITLFETGWLGIISFSDEWIISLNLNNTPNNISLRMIWA